QLQAEEGIKNLKQYVDTLLVISNDKLRHQFGNLKMKEAFAKADNVLATAAKCITDVISSTGQINVDFADVCTVMRNGGVAILGSASAEGESRAQKAVEEALNSPLLNDNDIRGAKWILININSAEGDHEFTMDEVEIIQNYILNQAGEETDVIMGLGYDNNLDRKLGITLIATGFEYKDPFTKREPKKEEPRKEEKIVMVLGQTEEKPAVPVAQTVNETKPEETVTATNTVNEELMPKLVDETAEEETPVKEMSMATAISFILDDEMPKKKPETIHWELNKEEKPASDSTNKENSTTTVDKMFLAEKNDKLNSSTQSATHSSQSQESKFIKHSTNPVSAASGGYLARPSNIYAEAKAEEITSKPVEEEPVTPIPAAQQQAGEDPELQLVIREDIPAADEPLAHQTLPPLNSSAEEPALQDMADEQQRRAAERLQKLRNLSFNVNAADPNNEFETVPAYIRRNMELYGNSISAVENFYSSYEVKTDNNNQTQISTINTFLEGKKPD
ncbi:MAG: cell division FtsZ family protein, partial [Bacteroidetes bacterium]|nr:cell division FtsZ family protein [Bacteroidota bacterium]